MLSTPSHLTSEEAHGPIMNLDLVSLLLRESAYMGVSHQLHQKAFIVCLRGVCSLYGSGHLSCPCLRDG